MDVERRTVEAKGIMAPLPLLELRKALDSVDRGGVVELVSDDPAMGSDVEMFLAASGHELADTSDEGGVFRFVIRKL